MEPRSPEVSAVAVSAQAKIDDIRRHPLFRFGMVALSIAGVYLLFRLAYEGFLPSFGAGAHAKTGPVLDVLKTLHSGLGN
jgi:hypothetical protein